MLPVGHGHGFIGSRGGRRRCSQDLFDPVDVQAAVLAAVLKTVQDFSSLIDLSGLKMENTQGSIAARPFGSKSTSRWKCRPASAVLPSGRSKTQAPKNLSRAWDAGLSLQQCLLCASDVMLPQLQQRQRQIILIVVWITADGIAVNLFSAGGVTQVRVDIS